MKKRAIRSRNETTQGIISIIVITIMIAIAFFAKDRGMTGQFASEQNETISANETIMDINNNLVGKQIQNEITFETTFTTIQKNEENLLLEFHHNSQTEQPIWIEGNINYSISNNIAIPLESMTLIVPKIEGIVPKFKLHVGSASDIFEFGKTIPTINFEGESMLIDRSDEKIDLKLIKEDSRIEIKGLNNVETINAKILPASEPKINTDIFASDSIAIDNATISLPKKGKINTILECAEFNTITDSCPTEWTQTNITFTENETHIQFIVQHFSGYAGAEINIINIQSYPSLYGNWTVKFNTTGIANLTIKATNGTTWGLDESGTDLQFLEIKCGENILNYSWIDNSVFIPNYNCTTTSQETSKPMTTGKHILEFTYGEDIKYAYNDVITSCGVTINTSTTLTSNLNSNGTCITIGNNSVTLDCAGFNITGNATGYGINITRQLNVKLDNCNVYNFSNGVNIEYSNYTIVNNVTSALNSNGIRLNYADTTLINNSLVRNNTNHGINAVSSHNNTVFNTTAKANTNIGFYFNIANSLNLTSSKVYNTSTNDGIQVFYSNNSFVIDNLIKNNYDDAFVSGNLLNSTIRGNTIEGSSTGRGFNIKSNGQNNTIENNVIGNCSYYGVENSNGANGNVIANNTIINCTYGISQYIVNDTVIRNNTIKQCAHGIDLSYTSDVRGIKIIGNTISESHNKSTTTYQYLPAGIFIESYPIFSGGNNIETTIYNNTIINNSHGIIVWVRSGSINISNNQFINNTKGAMNIIGGNDLHIEGNTYTNDNEGYIPPDAFEPVIITKDIPNTSINITLEKHLLVNSTIFILTDSSRNEQNIAPWASFNIWNSSGDSVNSAIANTANSFSPKVGKYIVLRIPSSDTYKITLYPAGWSNNATPGGLSSVSGHTPANITLTMFSMPKSVYSFIQSSNITIKNENINGNTFNGVYLLNSSNINIINISITNSPNSFVINAMDVNLSNSNIDNNWIIQNTDFGNINFTQDINITSARSLNNIINITQSQIHVNTLSAPEFNKSAILTFKNISHLNLVDPRPMVDLDDDGTFEACTDCTEISYTNNETFVYSVSHFTTYGMNETPLVNPPGGSKGGGGVGGVIRKTITCTESWTCNEWGPCIDNLQIRYCIDMNNCGTTQTEPEETKECTLTEQTIPQTPAQESPAEILQEESIPVNKVAYGRAVMGNVVVSEQNKQDALLLLLTAIMSVIIIITLSKLPKLGRRK